MPGFLLLIAAGLRSLLPSVIQTIRRTFHLRRIRQGGAGHRTRRSSICVCSLSSEAGYEKPSWLTPAEFARVIPESRTGRSRPGVHGIYQQLRYGNTSAPGERMLVLLDELGRAAIVP